MIDPIQKLDFLPSGHFYDMVNTYNTSVSGLLLYHSHFQPTLDALNVQKQGKLVGIGSRIYPALEIRPHEIISLINNGFINLGQVTDNLSYMLLNIAYESVKQLLNINNPVHEFFRHLRHGASHGGKWSLIGEEPKRNAEWRGRKVTKDLQGKKLWELDLGPGDLMVLLWDIEQTLR